MPRRTAFVTGAAQGIGAAIAIALARDRFDVAVSSRETKKLAEVVRQIEKHGGRAAQVALDLRSQQSIEKAMVEVVRNFGQLEVLVNNAGLALKKPAVEVTAADWNALIETNLTGTFFLTQQIGKHLIATKKHGCIISIASTHAVVGMAQRSVYGISKAAILQMTRALAIEWAEHGIRVNAVAPGRVETPSRAGSFADPSYLESALSRIPTGRLGKAEEIAAAVTYLASPLAEYITGQTLFLDGGLTAA
jgi:NAD(P)-dependent dehydrogenase (short-subunit alcohol dehydrogenase family)